MSLFVKKLQYSTLHLQRLVQQRLEIRLDTPERMTWTVRQHTAFLETILLGIPVPPIYLQETANGQLRVIDGYNRLTSILEFLAGQIVLENMPFLSDCQGRRFQELDANLKGTFEDYQLTFYILPARTEQTLVDSLRERLNE